MRLPAIFLFAMLASTPMLTHAADLQPLMCERGKLLLSEDFASGTLNKDWQVAKGKYEIVDGALKGTELAADNHPGVLNHALKARNLIAQFEIRFEGGKGASLSLNSSQGHVCRAAITPTGFTVNKDSRDKNKTDKAALLGSHPIAIKSGEWHTLLVEICGPEIVAQLDGPDHVAFGAHDGLDVDKATIRFPVTGDSIFIKNLRVWEAGTRNANWDATKKTLEAQRLKTPAKKAAGARSPGKNGAAK